METFKKNKDFIYKTIDRLYKETRFKFCSQLELGALVELEQQHLDGSTKPAAWITEDKKYVAYGNGEVVYFMSREKLFKMSKIKTVKYYKKTKTRGFHITQEELKNECSFNF